MVKTRRSSMIDDQAGCDGEDSENSMEDLTIAERAVRLTPAFYYEKKEKVLTKG